MHFICTSGPACFPVYLPAENPKRWASKSVALSAGDQNGGRKPGSSWCRSWHRSQQQQNAHARGVWHQPHNSSDRGSYPFCFCFASLLLLLHTLIILSSRPYLCRILITSPDHSNKDNVTLVQIWELTSLKEAWKKIARLLP